MTVPPLVQTLPVRRVDPARHARVRRLRIRRRDAPADRRDAWLRPFHGRHVCRARRS